MLALITKVLLNYNRTNLFLVSGAEEPSIGSRNIVGLVSHFLILIDLLLLVSGEPFDPVVLNDELYFQDKTTITLNWQLVLKHALMQPSFDYVCFRA